MASGEPTGLPSEYESPIYKLQSGEKYDDAIDRVFTYRITPTTPFVEFNGRNFESMFGVIKHYIGTFLATVIGVAAVNNVDAKIHGQNIDNLIRLLKFRGIFLIPAASKIEEKINPKLYINNGFEYIKMLLENYDKASVIETELNTKMEETIREYRSKASAALKAAEAAANAAAEELVKEATAEAAAAEAKTQSAKAKKAAAASKKAAAREAPAASTKTAASSLAEPAREAPAASKKAASSSLAEPAREAPAASKKAAAALKKTAGSEAPAALKKTAAISLAELAREAAAEYNATKVAKAPSSTSPMKLPNAPPNAGAGAGAPPNAGTSPMKLPNAPPSAGAGGPSSASNSLIAAAQAHMQQLKGNPAAAEAARKRTQKLVNAAKVARSLANTERAARNARAAAITADPAVQHYMHWIMASIHKRVYNDPQIVTSLNEIIRAALTELAKTKSLAELKSSYEVFMVPITPATVSNVVRLYFHGGNSVSFYTKARNALDNIPYESDFDMTCLVNPYVPGFAQVRSLFFNAIFYMITSILNTDENTDIGKWKKSITTYYGLSKFTRTNTYNVFDYLGPVYTDDTILFTPEYMTKMKSTKFRETPLKIKIIPNVGFTGEDTLKQLGIASIKMLTTTTDINQIELFEITFPSRQYEHLETLWEVVELTTVTMNEQTFNVPTPVSLYLEQRIAYEGTPPSLSEKKSTRLTRSNNMKRYVRAKYNAGNAKIKFNLNSVIGDYEEPIWSYINNIKE